MLTNLGKVNPADYDLPDQPLKSHEIGFNNWQVANLLRKRDKYFALELNEGSGGEGCIDDVTIVDMVVPVVFDESFIVESPDAK